MEIVQNSELLPGPDQKTFRKTRHEKCAVGVSFCHVAGPNNAISRLGASVKACASNFAAFRYQYHFHHEPCYHPPTIIITTTYSSFILILILILIGRQLKASPWPPSAKLQQQHCIFHSLPIGRSTRRFISQLWSCSEKTSHCKHRSNLCRYFPMSCLVEMMHAHTILSILWLRASALQTPNATIPIISLLSWAECRYQKFDRGCHCKVLA